MLNSKLKWKNIEVPEANNQTDTPDAVASTGLARATWWAECLPGRVRAFVASLRDSVTNVQTCNSCVKAVKQFCKWMVQDGRASESPIAHTQGTNVDADRRHDRDVYTPKPPAALVVAAENGRAGAVARTAVFKTAA